MHAFHGSWMVDLKLFATAKLRKVREDGEEGRAGEAGVVLP